MFLGYGGEKEFVVKSYVDASFAKYIQDLNVADPLTKLLSQAKHDHTLVVFGS